MSANLTLPIGSDPGHRVNASVEYPTSGKLTKGPSQGPVGIIQRIDSGFGFRIFFPTEKVRESFVAVVKS